MPNTPEPSNTSDAGNPATTSRNMFTKSTVSSSPTADAYSPMASNQQVNGQQAWPSPPLAPGDVHFNYALQDSPYPYSNMMTEQTYTPASPGGWCASVPVMDQIAPGYYSQKTLNPQPLSDVCTPTSSADFGLDSPGGFFLQLNGENTEQGGHQLWGMNCMPTLDNFATSSVSQSTSVANSAHSMGMNRDATIRQYLESRSVPPSTTRPLFDFNDLVEGDRTGEPYAKLMYKAFMSRPDYSMTLQELYQWFRENTTKATTEKGGWQNSIRHNLSMNAAFRKREVSPFTKSKCQATSTTADSTRVNEWFLEDWAILNGVQSTTRYRKGNQTKRGGSRRKAGPRTVEHSAKRAASGRKGGCATRASRKCRQSCLRVTPLKHAAPRLLEHQPPSPARSSIADMYGMSPPAGAYYDPMPYYQSVEDHQVRIARYGDGVNTTPSLPYLRLADSNAQQMMSNTSNPHHVHHTVSCDAPMGKYRMPSPMVGLSELPGPSGGEYQTALACASSPLSSDPPSVCYQSLMESPNPWLDNQV